MSRQYDDYLYSHITNVMNAYRWIVNTFPEYVSEYAKLIDFDSNFDIQNHDKSKWMEEEYDAYDAYFYGGNKSFAVVNDFNRAWLHHIHKNPHHWQHWVLMEDDPKSGENYICIEMPKHYVLEMIADWWSFSWKSGNLYEVFDWYFNHKNTMKLHKNTRKLVEDLLDDIRKKLDENDRESVKAWVDQSEDDDWDQEDDE